MKPYILGIFILILFSGCGTYGRKSSITNPNVLAEEMRQKSPSNIQENQQKPVEVRKAH